MSLLRPVIGLCLGLLLTLPAIAETPPPATPGLMRLHDALHLTADQEPAWTAYTAAISLNATAQRRHQATEQLLPQLTTPRRIALIEATMDADRADLHRQGLAVTKFYNQLTPGQQRAFDTETLAPQGGSPQDGQGPARPLPRPPGY